MQILLRCLLSRDVRWNVCFFLRILLYGTNMDTSSFFLLYTYAQISPNKYNLDELISVLE